MRIKAFPSVRAPAWLLYRLHDQCRLINRKSTELGELVCGSLPHSAKMKAEEKTELSPMMIIDRRHIFTCLLCVYRCFERR